LQPKRSSLIIGVLLIVAAYYSWWIFGSGDIFYRHSANAANREAILRLYSTIRVGDDREAVLKAYWSQRTEDLRLHVDVPASWVVAMPGEFGATDWTLVVEFRNDKVSAVRMRTADGPRPTGGPPDKGA
jgi:hypothetical protein